MPADARPDDPAAEVVAAYLEAMLAIPHRHADAWPLLTFDLRARMARLMVDDVDRVDPRAVSTVLDGPTPGNVVWDAFEGWHSSHVRVLFGVVFTFGVELASEPIDDDTRAVHMQGTAPYAHVRRTFGVRHDGAGWKVDTIPEGVDVVALE